MVSLSRVSTDGAVVARRDSTVASVWRDLNRFAVRVAAIAGYFGATAYATLGWVSGDTVFYHPRSLPLEEQVIVASTTKRVLEFKGAAGHHPVCRSGWHPRRAHSVRSREHAQSRGQLV